MKLALSNLEKAIHMTTSKQPPIPFLVPEKESKLIPLDYQVYKLHTNPKDDKSPIYLHMV
eukprot:3359129-Ditylum_brightwellii.AAC.1